MFKKVITIVLPIIAVTAAIFIFGFKVYQDSFDKFQYDGYVIGTAGGKESAKHHFTKDEKYKVNKANNEVEFTNNEDEEVIVSNASFVHYADGSISTFKKAVVLNLENVKTDSLQYYNIFNGSVFTKTKKGYQIQYLEDKLLFNNFIVKISDSKYMIVGKNLEITYGDKKETIKDGFLEINYLDGNIIRVENQDFLLQNISSDFKITIEDINVDLPNKKIIYDEETKINLGEITIDSNDNIEIIPDEENTKIDEEAMNKIESLENSPVVTPGTNVDGMESGIVNTDIEKTDEIIQENEKIPDAVFKTTLFKVTPSMLTTKISVDDEANTLKGEMTWKVIENSTNNIVCQNRVSQGKKTIEAECLNLNPSTNYSLIVSSKYEKNEVTYEKDFLQRTFITGSSGINIIKDYVSTDTLAFKIQIPEESDLTSFTYQIIESANPTKELNISGSSGSFIRNGDSGSCNNEIGQKNENGIKINECEVVVEGIKPNTKYSLVVKNISHSNFELKEEYEIYKTVTTLKQKPSFGQTRIITNKLSSKFSILLNYVKDPNNSILSYRAEVYPYNTKDDENTLIMTTEASISNQIDINIDGENLKRGESYIAKIFVTYYDNEKEYDIQVGESEIMNMTSLRPPTLVLKDGAQIFHDKIEGIIEITDPDKTIITDNEKVTVDLFIQNMSEITERKKSITTTRSGEKIIIELNLDNLQANSSYRFTVKTQIKLEDGTHEVVNDSFYGTVGEFFIQTPIPDFQRLWLDSKNIENQPFAIEVVLTPNGYQRKESAIVPPDFEDGDDQKENKIAEMWHEIDTMETIKFRLMKKTYEINGEISDAECEELNYCWIFEFKDDPSTESNEIKNLYSSHTKGGAIFTPKVGTDTNKMTIDLDIPTESETGGALPRGTYILEVLSIKDYTDYENEINLISDEFTQKSIEFSVSGTHAQPDKLIFVEDLTRENNGKLNMYTITTAQSIYDMETGEEGSMLGHYLVNLTTGDTCELNSYLGDNVSDNSIQINIPEYNKFNEIENCDIVSGQSYGYYYEYEVKIDDKTTRKYGANKTFRPFVDSEQPYKTVPDVQAVISKTTKNGDNYNYEFKYRANNPAEETGSTEKIQYKNSNVNEWESALCEDEEDCIINLSTPEGTFKIPAPISSSKISVRTMYQTMQGSDGEKGIDFYDYSITGGTVQTSKYSYEYTINDKVEEIILVNEMPVEAVKGPITEVKEVIVSKDLKNNSVIFTFNGIDGTDRVLGANLIFSAPKSEPVVLYRNFDDEKYKYNSGLKPQITILYGDIIDLMGKGKISTDIKLIYDKNFYGYNPGTEEIVAFESLYGGSLEYEKMNSLTGFFKNSTIEYINETKVWNLSYENFEDETNTLSLKEDETNTLSLKNEKGLMYTTTGIKKHINVKTLGMIEIDFDETFDFDSLTPTLIMDETDVIPTYGGVQYNLELFVENNEDFLDTFQIHILYYSKPGQNDKMTHWGSDNKQYIYTKTYSYSDLKRDQGKFIIKDNNLLQQEDYYAVFKWSINNDGNYNSFLYDKDWNANYPNEDKIYHFKTTAVSQYNPSINIEYERGTDPSISFNERGLEYNNVSNSRVLYVYSKLNLENNDRIRDMIVEVLVYKGKDNTGGDIWENWYTTTTEDSITNDQHYLSTRVSLDPKENGEFFPASTKFKVIVTPRSYCDKENDPEEDKPNSKYACKGEGVDAYRNLDSFSGEFTYQIKEPTISIIRTGSSDFKITVDDRYRAVGNFRLKDETSGKIKTVNPSYTINLIKDNEASIELSSFVPEKPVDSLEYTGVLEDCIKGAQCQIVVTYNVETTNTGQIRTMTKTKNINTSYAYDTGTINKGSVSSNKIQLLFKDSFNINTINKYDCTISQKVNDETLIKSYNLTNVTANFYTVQDELKAMDINLTENLSLGSVYYLTIHLKDNKGALLDEWSIDNIIYVKS